MQKMRIAPMLEELIKNASIKYYSPISHESSLFKNGFNNYQGKVHIDDTIFRYIVRIGKAKNDNIFYDLSLEKIDTEKGIANQST